MALSPRTAYTFVLAASGDRARLAGCTYSAPHTCDLRQPQGGPGRSGGAGERAQANGASRTAGRRSGSGPPASGLHLWPGQAVSLSTVCMRALSWSTALVWIWHTRLSVTPRTWPISARVKPS